MENTAGQSTDTKALRDRLGYIDEEQLFALLSIKPGTGRNRQSAGSLPPHYKVGREKLYKVSEVEAWIKRRRVNRSHTHVPA